ncbi:hypothetical protein [Streptomyces phaeoluteigriseus]|uniref:hypothetical protein n=1 Tax=Streptomyces phaeoluteigriseus TaxID=114686 RepID=UPI0036CF66B3
MQPHPSSSTEPTLQPQARSKVHRRTPAQACAWTPDGTPDIGVPFADTVKESA